MATRAITYVWKIERPNNEVLARIFMAAAYQTATKVDPGVTTVLIRLVLARIRGLFLWANVAHQISHTQHHIPQWAICERRSTHNYLLEKQHPRNTQDPRSCAWVYRQPERSYPGTHRTQQFREARRGQRPERQGSLANWTPYRSRHAHRPLRSMEAMFPFLLATAFSFRADDSPHHALVAIFLVLYTIVGTLFKRPLLGPPLRRNKACLMVMTSAKNYADRQNYLGLQPGSGSRSISLQLRDLSTTAQGLVLLVSHDVRCIDHEPLTDSMITEVGMAWASAVSWMGAGILDLCVPTLIHALRPRGLLCLFA